MHIGKVFWAKCQHGHARLLMLNQFPCLGHPGQHYRKRLREIVNLQKVNLPKSQPINKMTKMLCLMFLASLFFGKLTFWK
jgi:hypothetical protein